MYLCYFEEPAYDKLKQNISDNVEHYKTEDICWLDKYFDGINYYKTSGVMVQNADLIYEADKKLSTEEKNIQDLANVWILYDSYKNLTPLQATDKYLWSYLAHTVFKKYVVSRWINNPDNDKIQTTITDKFFVNGTSGLMTDNAISRLWWAGYLTYDEDNTADPYNLTRILLAGQQVWTDILDTPFCGNKKIIKGFLLGIKKCQEEKKVSANIIRECVKYFRRYAAVTNVDFLEEKEIEDLIFAFLIKK